LTATVKMAPKFDHVTKINIKYEVIVTLFYLNFKDELKIVY